MSVEVREARGVEELTAALALRHAVFVEEQQVPADLELDGHDEEATHLVAVEDGRVLGTLRLLPRDDWVSLGRLAVSAAARRRGIASRLLEGAERWAREHGARAILLSAQTYARGLYEAAGYEVHGEPYEEAGIEHVQMERSLA